MVYMYTNIKPKWPDDKKFAVCLTHDVDRVKKTYQYLTRFEHFLKKLEIKNAFNEIFCFLKFYFSKDPKKDPYWNFEIIMEIERKFGVRSTFAREAACMGTPAVSFYPGNELLSVDEEMIRRGWMFHSRDPEEIVEYVLSSKRRKVDFSRSKNIQTILSK